MSDETDHSVDDGPDYIPDVKGSGIRQTLSRELSHALSEGVKHKVNLGRHRFWRMVPGVTKGSLWDMWTHRHAIERRIERKVTQDITRQDD